MTSLIFPMYLIPISRPTVFRFFKRKSQHIYIYCTRCPIWYTLWWLIWNDAYKYFFLPPPSGPAPPPVASAPGAAPAGRPVFLLTSGGRGRPVCSELRGVVGEGTEGRRTIPGEQGAAHLRRCGECIAKSLYFLKERKNLSRHCRYGACAL